jgi:hypothetical protein
MRVAYVDLEQAESRVVGAICLRLFGDSTYLDAVEAGDIHSYVAKMNKPELPWPEEFDLAWLKANGLKQYPPAVLAAAKKLSEGINLYRDRSLRFCMKPLGHGSNYLGQPNTMAKHSHLPQALIEHFQSVYFDPVVGFHCIKRWHEWVRETIQTRRELTTMLGRRIFVLKDPTAASTLREMVAFEPQSVGTGDYMNAGMMLLDSKNLPLHLLKQVHDALAFEYDRRDEDWLIPEVCSTLSWTFPLTPEPTRFTALAQKKRRTAREEEDFARLQALLASPRPFSIPVEPMVGWNLAKRDKGEAPKNPNGLILWQENKPDQRKRITRPSVTQAERFAAAFQLTH